MALRTPKKWKKYLPDIDLYIRIPFVIVATEIFHEAMDMYAYNWLVLYVKIYKWEFRFKLYTLGDRF